MRVALRSASIDYNGRFCMSSAAAAATKAFGIDRGMPFPLADIARADTVMLVGSNPADTMPPAMRWFAAGVERGARHLVVDPRYTATAATADVHLQPVPGTDLALANGLLHLAIKHRLVDAGYVAERTTGWPAVRRAMRQYWPDRVERITGVPVRVMERAVHLLAESRATMILSARGAEQHAKGSDTALALDQPGARARPARPPVLGLGDDDGPGQRPGRARARPEGRPAARLPDARRPRGPRARRRRLGHRPRRAPAARGLRLRDARPPRHRRAACGRCWSWRRTSRSRRRGPPTCGNGSATLDFLCVSDLFLSETAELADVVLPCAQWAEEEGTMTNLEGRVLRRRRAVEAPDGVRSDLVVLAEIADRLGRGAFFDREPRAVFDELRRASAGGTADYAGISYERIDAERGVFWPCPPTTEWRTPARRACSRTASPPRTGAPASTSCTTATPPSRPTTSTRTA